MTDAVAGRGRPTLVLTGPPGALVGEVAAALGAELGAPVADTDALVAEAAGVSLGELFVDEGEQAFRVRERHAVAAALGTEGAVVALGSGAVEDSATRAELVLLRDAGTQVVFLDVSLAHAVPRIGFNQPRPAGLGNPRQLWSELMDARRGWYEQVASRRVVTDGRSAAEVAALVLAGTSDGQEEW